MGVYDRQIATAQRLISEKGQTVTWRQTTDGAPGDAGKPWKPGAASVVDNSIKMVFLPDNKTNREFIRMMTGSTVPFGNYVGLMGAQSFTPNLKDSVIRGSETLGVITIDPLAPNGDIILYTVRFAV